LDSLPQYIELFRSQCRKFTVIDGTLWARRGAVVEPIGPFTTPRRLSKATTRSVFRTLGGTVVMCAGGTDLRPEPNWFAVACREHLPVEDLSAHRRRNIRKAFRTFSYRRIEFAELAETGHSLERAAIARFRNTSVSVRSHSEFSAYYRAFGLFPEITEAWGAFTPEGDLVAFALNYLFDQEEVLYGVIRLHPDHLKNYLSYGLIRAMNEHYLVDRKFAWVNDGYRAVLHDSNIQEFLIRELGFARVGVHIQVGFRPLVGTALRVAKPLRSVLDRYPVARSAFAIAELRRSG
jgi:hypothetical protein